MLRETQVALGETKADYISGYNPIAETKYHQPAPYNNNVFQMHKKESSVEPKRKRKAPNAFLMLAAVGMSAMALYFGAHGSNTVISIVSGTLSVVFFPWYRM